MPTPSSPSSRDRETREAPDTALLSKPETYGSFATVPSVPGATSRDASSILPGSPTYGSGLSSSPFLNTPDRAAYARGRSMAAAAAAEAGDAHPDPRAEALDAFAADLESVVRQPSDATYVAAGREDPTTAMLREFKRALEAGDDDELRLEHASGARTPGALLDAGTFSTRARNARGYGSAETLRDDEEEEDGSDADEEEATSTKKRTVEDASANDARTMRELEALTIPILAGSEPAGRAGYGSTSGERAASPGRASARMRRRARARTDPEPKRFGADTFEASAPPVTPLFKIQCGKCGCVLKIPGQIAVFRCPRCAAKLRTPPGAFADDEERRLPRREDESRDPERRRETAERTQKRDAFDEELASLRLAREALERHVAFSKSLEGVVGELVKRVPRVAA